MSANTQELPNDLSKIHKAMITIYGQFLQEYGGNKTAGKLFTTMLLDKAPKTQAMLAKESHVPPVSVKNSLIFFKTINLIQETSQNDENYYQLKIETTYELFIRLIEKLVTDYKQLLENSYQICDQFTKLSQESKQHEKAEITLNTVDEINNWVTTVIGELEPIIEKLRMRAQFDLSEKI